MNLPQCVGCNLSLRIIKAIAKLDAQVGIVDLFPTAPTNELSWRGRNVEHAEGRVMQGEPAVDDQVVASPVPGRMARPERHHLGHILHLEVHPLEVAEAGHGASSSSPLSFTNSSASGVASAYGDTQSPVSRTAPAPPRRSSSDPPRRAWRRCRCAKPPLPPPPVELTLAVITMLPRRRGTMTQAAC